MLRFDIGVNGFDRNCLFAFKAILIDEPKRRKGVTVVNNDVVAGLCSVASNDKSTADYKTLRQDLAQNPAERNLELDAQFEVVFCTDVTKAVVETLCKVTLKI